MSDNGNLFEEAEERSTTPGFGSGDFADWWEPDEEDGEHLVGVVVEKHSAPEDWTDPGEVPDTIYTVLSLGRGDVPEGEIRTPKQHKQLKQGLSGADVGDVVNIQFDGYEKVQGNVMNTYEVGFIKQDEWEEMDGSDDVEEAIQKHKDNGGIWGDNTRSEPYTEAADSGGSSGSPTADDGVSEAANYLADVVDLQGGSISHDQAEKMLNEVNDYDVDIEAAALEAGLQYKDETIEQ